MFRKLIRNNEIAIRVRRTDENDTAPVVMDAPLIDSEKILPIAKEIIRDVAIAVGSVIVLSIVAATIGDVVVEKSKQKNDNPYAD